MISQTYADWHRMQKALTEAQVDAAIASLDKPQDNALVARWIANFLRSASSA